MLLRYVIFGLKKVAGLIFNDVILQYCLQRGGYLAEITSQEETDLLNGIIPDELHHWIGLHDIGTPGHFYWQYSKQPVIYSNWGRTQAVVEPYPFNTCVNLGDVWNQFGHQWYATDSGCGAMKHALCEADNFSMKLK